MKKSLLLFVVCFLSYFANAQTPSLTWVRQMGKFGGFVTPRASVVDASGNVITTGLFKNSIDFDPGAGVSTLTSVNNPNTANNQNDIFISKVDSNGNFVWAKQLAGIELKDATAVGVDAAGNVYTTGFFYGTVDFDPGAGVSNLTSKGYNDIFISKLDASGNFVWAKLMGSIFGDSGYAITVDPAGNVFTTGSFSDTCDFDPNAGVSTMTALVENIFISKLDTNGNFVWAKSMGGIAYNRGRLITSDAAGNVYVGGTFGGTTDFDPNAGVANLTSVGSFGGNEDMFILKLDLNGSYVWAKQFSGTGTKFLKGMAVDASGNIFTAGMFSGTVDFNPSAAVANLSGPTYGDDGFISKLDAAGNYVWVKQLEGTIRDVASLALDTAGNIYTTGNFYSDSPTDFDVGVGIYNLSIMHRFGDDTYILKLNASGSFVWVKQIGGVPSVTAGADTIGKSIVVDGSGNIYTTGTFGSSTSDSGDFDPNAGVALLTPTGGSADMFVHKMGQTALGLSKKPIESKITIYPNPSSGIFNIEIDENSIGAKATIYNLLGQKVKEFDLKTTTTTTTTNQTLNKGIYLLEIEKEGNRTTKKLMVK
ncbi:SBBP repeat-containing protein [Flavobacterium nackdongense]|uniref:T9SS type A sorting domain-containing protein n=1 Tax=Flavobacterium nackdongense TaxID=2547394 RepID=A0A4P6Y7N9_9FLAO|nr:SBBP repeat-containing protein [Flavobacterium nackdongense]QBN18636.1 T9SS type A sorting domain-containing protein [Flavobacterium nackdongense]